MDGATNVRRHLGDVLADPATHRVLGLCDEAEAPFFVRALSAAGAEVRTPDDLPAHGFHTCGHDLETELIRALGTRAVLGVVGELDLEQAFELFTHQRAWRGRPPHEQLHRFVGTTSGRKELVARALAQAVPDDAVPPPLRALLDQVELALAAPTGPPVARFPLP